MPRVPTRGRDIEPLVKHTESLRECGDRRAKGLRTSFVLPTCARVDSMTDQRVADPTVCLVEEVSSPVEGMRDGIPIGCLALKEGTKVLGKRRREPFILFRYGHEPNAVLNDLSQRIEVTGRCDEDAV